MSEIFRASGKKSKLPDVSGQWSFEQRPGGWWLAVTPSGARHRFMVHRSGGSFSASVRTSAAGRLWHGEIQKEKTYSSGGSASGGDSDWVAQFPGKVRKILVKAGAQVKEGDPLLLVEAMKMEFPVKAPMDCRITRVLVREEQQLSPGDRFFEIETLGGENNGQ